jgi:hypothetical protein
MVSEGTPAAACTLWVSSTTRPGFELCPDAAGGVRFNIEKITMDSDREAHVRATRLIAVLSYQFMYEGGHWRFVPDDQAMRDYRTKTPKQMAAARRARDGVEVLLRTIPACAGFDSIRSSRVRRGATRFWRHRFCHLQQHQSPVSYGARRSTTGSVRRAGPVAT